MINLSGPPYIQYFIQLILLFNPILEKVINLQIKIFNILYIQYFIQLILLFNLF